MSLNCASCNQPGSFLNPVKHACNSRGKDHLVHFGCATEILKGDKKCPANGCTNDVLRMRFQKGCDSLSNRVLAKENAETLKKAAIIGMGLLTAAVAAWMSTQS